MRLEEIDSGFGFLCHWRDRVRFEDLDWLGIDGSINFFIWLLFGNWMDGEGRCFWNLIWRWRRKWGRKWR